MTAVCSRALAPFSARRAALRAKTAGSGSTQPDARARREIESPPPQFGRTVRHAGKNNNPGAGGAEPARSRLAEA